MTTKETWLDPAVLEFVKSNSGKVDKGDVVSHFNTINVLYSINRLEEKGRIEYRELCAMRYAIYFIK